MKVETIELFGFESAIKALRLPFKGKAKSDTTFIHSNNKNLKITKPHKLYNEQIEINDIYFGEKDLRLLQNLIKNGDEHAKVIRGINVICSITAPRYFWSEMDTYRIGTERLCSESTMHCECKGFSGEELQKAKSEIKEGLLQERIQMFSYQTLRRIYKQRKTHRLPEWKFFCNWIKSLPLSDELITL